MANEKCKLTALKAMDSKRAKEAFDETFSKVDEIQSQTNWSPERKEQEIQKLIYRLKRESVEAKRRASFQSAKNTSNKEIWDQGAAKGLSPEEVVDSMLTKRTNGLVLQGNLENTIKAEKNVSLSKAVQVEQEVIDALKKGEVELEIIALSHGKTDGIKISDLGKRAFEHLRKVQDHLLARKQDVGFFVQKREGYLGRQIHNSVEILKMGADGYAKVLKQHFKFSPETNIDKVAKDLWADFSDAKSTYFSINDSVDASGKRFETARDLQFKDPEAEVSYRKLMKQKTIFSTMLEDIRRDARDIGAAQQFGPNFSEGFKTTMRQAREAAIAKGEKAIEAFDKKEKHLQAEFDFLTKGSPWSGKGMIATAARKMKQFQDVVRLHAAGLTTATDIAFSAGMISSRTGENFAVAAVRNMRDQWNMIGTKQSKANRVETIKILNTFLEDELFTLVNGGVDETIDFDGLGGRFHKWFMEKTGLPAQATAARASNAKWIANDLYRNLDKGFDDLYPGTRQEMKNMGITSKDWDSLRSGKVEELPDGTKILVTENIEGITDKQQRTLENKYAAFLASAGEIGSPTPGVKVALIKNSVDPNGVPGAMLSMAMQYKSFALSIPKTLESIAKTGRAEQGLTGYNNKVMAQTVAGALFMAAGVKFAKDTIKGKNPMDRDYSEPKQMLDLIGQAGVGAIYFDMFAADYSKTYINVQAQLLGPGMGTINDFAGLMSTLVDGDKSERAKAREVLRVLERNSPTIPYLRAALNRNVFDNLHRKMNTGKKLKKNHFGIKL